MTIKAKWTVNQYTLIFDTNGGSTIAPITQDYGTAITAPADPTKTGYTFAGWTPAIPTTMPAENLTVTAQWRYNGGGSSGYSYYTTKQLPVLAVPSLPPAMSASAREPIRPSPSPRIRLCCRQRQDRRQEHRRGEVLHL